MPGRFQWQKRYGPFSYSRSHIDSVIKYIDNQEDHHRKATFKDEYLRLLEIFDVLMMKDICWGGMINRSLLRSSFGGNTMLFYKQCALKGALISNDKFFFIIKRTIVAVTFKLID